MDGPFQEPANRNIRPLPEAAKLNKNRYTLDPMREDVCSFLNNQPAPDEGAFCYIAVTGELDQSESQDVLPV